MFLSPVFLICLAAPAPPETPDLHTVQTRAFRVPVQIDSRRNEIEKIRLFVSTDQGKNWKEAGTIGPTEESFRYVAPSDGVYWFAVQILLKDKTKDPADVKMLEPALKVAVETPKKPDWQPAAAAMEEELKQLHAEVRRLKERIAALEQLLKDKP